MRGFGRCVLCFVLSSVFSGCGGDVAKPTGAPPHIARTSGSAIALSTDERIAVATNRSAGVVSIFTITPASSGPPSVALKKELDMGAGSEPWSAIVGADDDTAYVVLRKAHQVARIRNLHGEPSFDARESVSVGAEPTSIAIAPSGRLLFVANWGEGTLSYLSTSPFRASKGGANLNAVLADSKLLGEVAARPGLAHPYALAVTDSGDADDSDETLYATEFFSQPVPGEPRNADAVDTSRQGIIYTVGLNNGQTGKPVSIGAVADTGFLDSDQRPTGCFPNQLYAAAINRGRLYVTSMCASPRGPLGPVTDMAGTTHPDNFKTLVHPAVFVVDTANGVELPEQRRLLTRALDDLYVADGDEAKTRMPLIPNDIAFGAEAPGQALAHAYVSSLGADAVFRLDYDLRGALSSVGDPHHRYISVKSGYAMPIGVAVSRLKSPGFALALNDGSQQLSVIDLATQAVTPLDTTTDASPRARALLGSPEIQGHHHFATGLDVWSFHGQARSSCESCHPGGLSDGVVWSFARGPRRTLSVANTYEKTHAAADRTRRLLLWGANVDEIHDVEAITRGVSGGVGGLLWRYVGFGQADNDCRLLYDTSQPSPPGTGPCASGVSQAQSAKYTAILRNGLNGSLAETSQGMPCSEDVPTCDTATAGDWDHIDAFIRSLRAPSAPTTLDADAVGAGHELFVQGQCAGCHGGNGWTVSRQFYQPGVEANGSLPHAAPNEVPNLGWLRTQTYAVPPPLRALNPAAAAGSATFRLGVPQTGAADAIAFVYSAATAGDDQLQCALRAVGTFPADGQPGVTVPGAPAVLEVRANGKPAQGKNGMNVPSLLGLSVGAPFFHAGNARTLEEVFDSQAFAQHHQALAPSFLDPMTDPLGRSDKVARLVAYLLSIDESTPIESIPSGFDLCVH